MSSTFYKFSVAVLLILSVLFVFFFCSLPLYADNVEKGSVKEEEKALDLYDIIGEIDGFVFTDYKAYYDYVIAHCVVNTKSSLTTLVNTEWIGKPQPDFNYAGAPSSVTVTCSPYNNTNSYSGNFKAYTTSGYLEPNAKYGKIIINFSSDTIRYEGYDSSATNGIHSSVANDAFKNSNWVTNSGGFYPKNLSHIKFSGNFSTYSTGTADDFYNWLEGAYTQVITYSISKTITNGTATLSASTVSPNGSTTITVSANAGYSLPSDITVTGTYSAKTNNGDGSWTITGIQSDISISATCPAIVYSLTSSITNGSGSFSPSTATYNTDVSLSITPSSGYTYPSALDITGTYDTKTNNGNGSWTITGVQSDLVVSATCPAITYSLTPSVTNGSGSFNPSSVTTNAGTTFIIVPDSGYTFPSDISISGTYGSKSNLGNGSWSIGGIQSNLTVSATCPVSSTYIANFSVANGSGSVTSPLGSSTSSVQFNSGNTVTVTVTPSAGYTYPSSLVVTGSYSSISSPQSGVFYIYNPTSNLNITAVCVAVSPSYVSVDYNFINCSLSYSQTVSGQTFTAVVVPASGYTYPLSVAGYSAGIPLSISYNATNGQLSISNCPSEITLSAQAVAVSADCDITYDLDHCTCSISYTSVSSGTVLSFTITPDSGYLLSDQETVVSIGGSAESPSDVTNSYSFSYSFTVTGDVDVFGVAVPYRQALNAYYQNGYNTGSINGGGSYSGSYRDGYNAGFTDGIESVNPSSLDNAAYNRYLSIYNSGVDAGIASVSASGSGSGLVAYTNIYNSAYTAGINSVVPSAQAGSLSQSQYDLIFTTGVNAVSSTAPVGSLQYQTYYDIYNAGYTVGENSVTAEGVSQSLTGFIPSVIASIGGGLLYTGEHITVFGITLASIFGLVILLAVGVWLFKIFKGAL